MSTTEGTWPTAAGDGPDRRRPEGLTGVLDALATAVRGARSMPMSSSVLVNRAELLDLVEQALELVQLLPKNLERPPERVPVPDHHVPAHARAARRNSRQIPEAARREQHRQVAVVAVRGEFDQRDGAQVGEMADRRDKPVVPVGRSRERHGPELMDELADGF